MKSNVLKINISLTENQKKLLIENYVKKELKISREIDDSEISTFLKAFITEKLEGEDFKMKLKDVEKRVKEYDSQTKSFILRDLFTASEWEKMKSYKKTLSSLLKQKCKDPDYREELGIKKPEDSHKNASGIQVYHKV